MSVAMYWGASGTELAQIVQQRATVVTLAIAPKPATQYPGASSRLASVLGQITTLSAGDQAKLARAFRAAEPAKTARVRQIGVRNTYRGFDDFMPAYTAAREAAAARYGVRWYLHPDACVKARIPSAWVLCHLSRGTCNSPRDVNIPTPRFWAQGALPVGPDYAGPMRVDPAGDVRLAEARLADRRMVAMRKAFPHMGTAVYGPAFALEPTPDGEMDTSRMAAD